MLDTIEKFDPVKMKDEPPGACSTIDPLIIYSNPYWILDFMLDCKLALTIPVEDNKLSAYENRLWTVFIENLLNKLLDDIWSLFVTTISVNKSKDLLTIDESFKAEKSLDIDSKLWAIVNGVYSSPWIWFAAPIKIII